MASTIRRVQANDVPAVVALVTSTLAEFGLGFGSAESDLQLRELPGSYDTAGGAFFVAELDGAIVGTAGVMPVEPGVLELRKMYLSPATRGHGVGQALFDACLAFAKGSGARRMVLDTTEMKAAIAFYERNGFVRDDTQRRASRCSRGYRLELQPHLS